MQSESDNLITPGVAAALSRTGKRAVAALDANGPNVTIGDLMAAERERKRRGLAPLRLDRHVRWTQQVLALLPRARTRTPQARTRASRATRARRIARSASRGSPGRSTCDDPPLPPDIASRRGEVAP
jgi:hypothetical protein